MQYWLMKSEPGTWSWQDQLERGREGDLWDGVRNHQAAGFLRRMEAGDQAFFYHSGKERRIMGIVEITTPAFPDPTDESGRFVAVRLRALEPLPVPVTLGQIREQRELSDLLLLRQSRLSVMPVTEAQWRRIRQLSGA